MKEPAIVSRIIIFINFVGEKNKKKNIIRAKLQEVLIFHLHGHLEQGARMREEQPA
jgi:hypothetical protein